jgi:hypothetical protein
MGEGGTKVSPDHDPHVAARRFAVRAALLLLPIVAVAFGAPRIVHLLRSVPPRAPAPLVQGALPGMEAPQPAEPKPAPPEAPTPEQIEKSREAQLALGKAQRGWESVSLLAPRKTPGDETGNVTLPFQGFGVSVESEPEGALVHVGGLERGETPLVAGVECAPGSDVKVRLQKPPLPGREIVVRCRENALVKLSVKLGR